ncbi:MAG: acyl-homoserine-lactone synthase [Rhodobacter sp.]|nr:acyl-homoserine-lactone synthase [Rhodobacter sp.]
MLRYLYGDELHLFPKLRDAMFRDRARQFRDRLHWDVEVGADGTERDAYDGMNPLYVIWQGSHGGHGGSLRFLPTTGDAMVNDHFTGLTGGARIQSPFIWECTRFCLGDGAPPRVSAALMLGGLEVGLGFHLSDAVGVFDARMVRIYRRLGWEPTVLGTAGEGRNAVSVGLWTFDASLRQRLLQRAGVTDALSRLWFEQAFRQTAPAPLAMAG